MQELNIGYWFSKKKHLERELWRDSILIPLCYLTDVPVIAILRFYLCRLGRLINRCLYFSTRIILGTTLVWFLVLRVRFPGCSRNDSEFCANLWTQRPEFDFLSYWTPETVSLSSWHMNDIILVILSSSCVSRPAGPMVFFFNCSNTYCQLSLVPQRFRFWRDKPNTFWDWDNFLFSVATRETEQLNMSNIIRLIHMVQFLCIIVFISIPFLPIIVILWRETYLFPHQVKVQNREKYFNHIMYKVKHANYNGTLTPFHPFPPS